MITHRILGRDKIHVQWCEILAVRIGDYNSKTIYMYTCIWAEVSPWLNLDTAMLYYKSSMSRDRHSLSAKSWGYLYSLQRFLSRRKLAQLNTNIRMLDCMFCDSRQTLQRTRSLVNSCTLVNWIVYRFQVVRLSRFTDLKSNFLQ